MAMTVERIAEDLGVTSHTVYKEIREGRLKAFRVGKRALRIDEAEYEKYKDRNAVIKMEEL